MSNLPRFTLRLNPALLKKVGYTAEYFGRSKNKEIEAAIKRYLKDFEALHGKIEIEEISED